MELTLRNVKGSKLTHVELDNNFLYLKQLTENNLPIVQPVSSGSLAWQDIDILPGHNPSIVPSPFLNLNLNANAGAWAEGVFFSGINNNPRDIVDGSFGVLKNISRLPILLKNNVSEADIPFNLSVNSDYILKPNAMLSMVYSAKAGVFNVMCVDSVEKIELKPKSEVFRLTEAEASQPNLFLKLAENPNLEEFVHVYINGLYVNNEDILIDGASLVIARPNVDYTIKEGMQVTVNYKY